MHGFKNLLLKFQALLFCAVLLGCNQENGHEKYKVFHFNLNEGLTSVDPAFAKNQPNIWVCNQLYNGLVELNDKMEVMPCVAKRWEISNHGKTYTFYLRKNVAFHPPKDFSLTQPYLTAYDVCFSLKRIIDTATASTGAWIFNDKVLRDASGKISDTCFVAKNDSVFTIHLQHPFPAFLQILAMPYAYIVSREAVEYYGKDIRTHPVGTGPFALKLWDEGNALLLEKNARYWKTDSVGQHLPYLDVVHVHFISDRNIAFMNFLKGHLHMVSGLDENSRTVIFNTDGTIKKEFSEKYAIYKLPYLNTEFLAFHVDSDNYSQKNHPILNKKVRKALHYAINKTQMVQYILSNVGVPGHAGLAPPYLYAHKANGIKGGYTYNLNIALKLLKEAHYDAQKAPPITLHTVARFPYLEVAEFIQREWAKIGINCQIELLTVPTLIEKSSKGELPLFRGSWLGDYPDPENYLTLLYSKNFAPNGPNRTHFKSVKFDDLYQKALMETNDSIRFNHYLAMEELMLEECPYIILWYDEVVRLCQKNIVGLEANPMNSLILEKVDILNPERE